MDDRKKKEELLFYTVPIKQKNKLRIPIATETISAGFPSPAENYIDGELDLNSYLISNPPATFFVRVSGESMINAGIHPNDILIVDRSLEVKNNDIIVAAVNGDFTVKRFYKKNNKIKLIPDNPDYKTTNITSDIDFEIWGIVTNVIHRVH
jgi:DNA polymerase V